MDNQSNQVDRQSVFGNEQTRAPRPDSDLRAKSRLIDNMAYQIRTLSNAIVGFSDLLLSESLNDDQHEYALEINQAGKGLSDLVNEVLDWTRLESGRLQLTRSSCSVRDLLDRIDQTLRPVVTEKGLAFELNSDAALPATLVTDADRLVKCLTNLAANAIQHTSEGFIHIQVRPDQQKDGSPTLRFEITDSSEGISQDTLATLFEPAPAEEQAQAEMVTLMSLGLSVTAGLPLTRQLAELLGGSIDVQSQEGKGSTFSLSIPAEIGAQAEVLDERPENTGHDHTGSESPLEREEPLPILVVEDQESNRTVLRLMLKTIGYPVETAENGKQAVQMALSHDYSLIIMDLKMPQMDGYEATEYLRNKNIGVPIVALSALTPTAEDKARLTALFDDFLCKPIDSEQLLAVTQRYAARPAALTAPSGMS